MRRRGWGRAILDGAWAAMSAVRDHGDMGASATPMNAGHRGQLDPSHSPFDRCPRAGCGTPRLGQAQPEELPTMGRRVRR